MLRCFTISIIIYFELFILLLMLYCFIMVALFALSEIFLCYHLASFLKLGHFAAYFERFFMFITFLSHHLHGVAFIKVSLHTYFTVRFMTL